MGELRETEFPELLRAQSGDWVRGEWMRTPEEIKLAIARLGARDESALEKGMQEVNAGRVRLLENVQDQLKRWASKC